MKVILVPPGLSTASTSFSSEYFFVDQEMTWTDAQSYCEDKFTDLASVHNYYDAYRLQRVMQGIGKSMKAWIGLYDDLSRWKWSLGFKNYKNEVSNWWPGEPNFKGAKENCVLMGPNDGQWIDYVCEEEYPAVCYYGEGYFYTLALKPQPLVGATPLLTTLKM